MKLLIIEDERTLSQNIANYLSKEDYRCEQAYTFDDAIEKVTLYDYDCILLDLMLPFLPNRTFLIAVPLGNLDTAFDLNFRTLAVDCDAQANRCLAIL